MIDLVPTILEVTGARRRPTPRDGRPIPAPPGKSLVPAFARDGTVRHDDLWWAHEGNRAIRVGDWKLVAAQGRALGAVRPGDRPHRDAQSARRSIPPRSASWHERWQRHMDEFTAIARDDLETGPGGRFGQAGQGADPARGIVPRRGASGLHPDAGRRKKRTPQPWIFYAPTLPPYPDSHEKWMHEQFLAAGVAVAGIDVGEAYGSPEGRRLFTEFYRELTEKRGFATRPCLLGRSRGGLWVTSWAVENPDKVAGIAGIYPVFDLRTYPGLDKAGPAYGLTPGQLKRRLAEFNPIERVGVLAKHRVPAFFIHGDEDKVVPLKENSAEFAARYRAAGAADARHADRAPGQGHNFWEGFFHCRELVDFAIERAREGAAPPKRNMTP